MSLIIEGWKHVVILFTKNLVSNLGEMHKWSSVLILYVKLLQLDHS